MFRKEEKLASSLEYANLSLLSKIKPKNFAEASQDEGWIEAMEEELNQIVKNQTWELVPRPKDKNVIGTKWVFRNKLNENGQKLRNKAILICKDILKMKVLTLKKRFP